MPVDDTSAAADVPAEPSRRLIITKLVADNFKSYAGRQEIGPFHKSFSAVVGPNGSGKSNVIDSLLFVFGYRASKMRQGKLSDLIHASSGHKNLDYCTVAVHFCEIIDKPGPDDYDIIPGSEIVVSRTAFRNNSSKYQLNGRTSSYTEVTTLLRDRGIDLDHKRFLILQGEVESIAQMKSKAQNEHEDGLLEYLEDIIGTSKYKLPIEAANKELEEISDQRNERLNRVMITEKEKAGLEASTWCTRIDPKKHEAETYIRAENELTTKKSSLYQRNAFECEQKAVLSEAATTELQEAIRAEEESSRHAREEIDALEQSYARTVEEYETIGRETNVVIEELAKFERADVQMQENRKHLVNKRKKTKKALQKGENVASESRTLIQNHTDDIQKYEREVEELEQSLVTEEAQLSAIVEGLKGKTEEFSQQIEAKQRELEPWTAQINEMQGATSVEEAEYNLLSNELVAGQKLVDDAKQTVVDLRQACGEKEKELQDMNALRTEAQQRLQSMQAEIGDAERNETATKAKVVQLRQQTEEARAALRSTQSRGTIIDSLMRLRDSGRLRGIYGRLGSLGAIDPRYDVAISTACPQLENLVVDNVETGQSCIDHLRRNKLGRGVFIVLDRLPHMNYSPIDTPEGVPRLFDLVQVKDPRITPAFYSVLRDTLVASNLEQANRIAYGRKRWRVVTLDGQLIDMAGTMSGGGGRPSRGRMSATLADDGISRDTVAELERQLETGETEWRTATERRKELQREQEQANRQLPELETLITKADMDLVAYRKRLPIAEKQVVDLSKQNKPKSDVAARMKQLESSIAKRTTQLQKVQKQAAAIEREIKALQDKILEVGGVRLRSQKVKVEGIKEQLESHNERIVRAQVALAKAVKDAEKAQKSCKEHSTALAQLEEEIEAVEDEIRQKTAAALEVRRRCEEAKMLMEEKSEQLTEMKSQVEEQQAVVKKFRVKEVELKNKLADASRTLQESQTQLAHWKDKLSKLSLHDIDDDEGSAAFEMPSHTDDELRHMDKDELLVDIQRLEKQLEQAKPNLSVLEEYRERHTEYMQRVKDLDDVTARRDTLKQAYDDLRKRRLDEFMKGFTAISYKVKEMYQMITLGGNAELELVDSLDPFSEGIVFSVMPPRKSWKNISNLSGGEKTLSSLALVFALHHFKPTPLYVMDEIDAALDFKNVSIVANYIKERTKNAQFIIISLRNNMFELADRLVGIYKTDNKTKSITINPKLVMQSVTR
ncbi:RecF/RecN/SMC [Thamnocephalis sphaerospora]|uniref:Structural maintenance of chromosomes protein n=1 Tax=Thamnocephalis sphaerospora TaxID=78915 RepID=A0A4P9XME5_9FUNG|nr:RecF/RecN/SMC [Thamnocephalis sphaerospora]|eukprot:RKP07022.1 RecF/RecN/SMC [Thamnocephalis sphaerospora]